VERKGKERKGEGKMMKEREETGGRGRDLAHPKIWVWRFLWDVTKHRSRRNLDNAGC